MNKDVVDVRCLGGTRLLLTFEGGEQREIELAAHFTLDGVFEPLNNPEFFRQVRVEPDVGTIIWPNGADFCPDVLYEKSRPAKASREQPSSRTRIA